MPKSPKNQRWQPSKQLRENFFVSYIQFLRIIPVQRVKCIKTCSKEVNDNFFVFVGTKALRAKDLNSNRTGKAGLAGQISRNSNLRAEDSTKETRPAKDRPRLRHT